MTPRRFLDRKSAPHILTLAVATAFGSLAMSIFLPSLPAIARHFSADYAVMQLAVTLYLVATAVLQLFIGPLSDRYGRRPVLLTFMCIALITTIGLIYAPTVEVFLAGRLLQGAAIAGLVVGRATVRDIVEPARAASMIGYVTMAMAVAPMVGPIIGGYLDQWFGWQSVFWALFAFGVAATALVWADLGETNLRPGGSVSAQLRALPELIGSRRFWGYSLTAAFAVGSFYAFVGGGPYLSSNHFSLPSSEFGKYFAIVTVGYVTGNFLSGRYAARIGINAMLLAGGCVLVVGMMLALCLDWLGFSGPMAAFGPIIFVGLGNGLALPSANSGIVSVRPHLAGSASGFGGFIQIAGGALMSALAVALLGPGNGPVTLHLLLLASGAISIVTTIYVIAVTRSEARRAASTAGNV